MEGDEASAGNSRLPPVTGNFRQAKLTQVLINVIGNWPTTAAEPHPNFVA
jgi:hypothetical protein